MLKRWRIRILLFLAVLGPGFITANIDNDSGGILTYSNAGAQFGYTLLWTMIPISKYISVPASDLTIWLLVVKGDYKRVEKVFLAASVFYITYIVTGVLSQPSWHDAMVATVKLPRGSIWHSKSYIYMIVGVIGTTISPWMQFYLQSSIVEKGVTAKSYPASRLDVIIGSFFTNIVAWFIVVTCSTTLFTHGMGAIKEAADAAEAMKPLSGRYAFLLFAVGLFNASLFAASILPLSTAYTVCEGLGLASGLDGGFKEDRKSVV